MEHISLYPLVFRPVLKKLVWGGAKLSQVLGKPVSLGLPIGESWELVDLPNDQSVVANGVLAGRTLNDLIRAKKADLLGPVSLDGGRFPLLVKYIDAALPLSVQLHPDEKAAARLGGRPKSEAWYVLHAEPGAVLHLGLKAGCTRAQFAESIAKGKVGELLVPVSVKRGDMVYIKPGTVHSIGAGVLLAEVQQPSDTTYRVFDWGRVGLDGKARELHIEQALECIDLESRPQIERLFLDTDHFSVRVLHSEKAETISLAGTGPIVLVGVEGETIVELHSEHSQKSVTTVQLGTVVLVPHVCRPITQLVGTKKAKVLEVAFPKK
ncbi:MAG: type I phosphomannose isomerase catalytic subunit [Pseudomonadota bacterium]